MNCFINLPGSVISHPQGLMKERNIRGVVGGGESR